MSRIDSAGSNPLLTPILVKSDHELAWPERERLFYLLARDGLYLCRQNEFFRSCVKTRSGPSELEEQRTFFEPRFPRIPAALRIDSCSDIDNAKISGIGNKKFAIFTFLDPTFHHFQRHLISPSIILVVQQFSSISLVIFQSLIKLQSQLIAETYFVQ